MKINIQTQDLAKAVKTLVPLCTAAKNSPAAGYLMMVQKGTELRLVGTDLTAAAEYTLEVEQLGDEPESSCLVSPIYLSETLAKMKAPTLSLTTDDKAVNLLAGKAASKLAARPAADFPVFPREEYLSLATVKVTDLLQALKTVAHSQSADPARAILNGVYIRTVNSEQDEGATVIECVATDGCQMSAGWFPANGPLEGFALPTLGAQLVYSSFAELDGECEILEGENMVTFVCQKRTITVRLLDGRYPNCDRMIALQHPCEFSVDAAAMLNAVELAGVTATGQRPSIKLQFTREEVKASALDANVGENEASVPATATVPDDFANGELHISPRRLGRALKAYQTLGDKITLHYESKMAALILNTGWVEGRRYKELIMPMSVK